MVTVPGVPATLVLTGLCVALLITGSSGTFCTTSVASLDLGCLLRWDCPQANANTTTYTVQTKTQGDPWQDVEGCVRISSQHCDVSQAFSDFELYNMIRLGLHQGPGSPVWTKPRKFDPSDFTFNSPSISVSLSRERLVVEVHFPCSTNRGCFPLQSCCPLSELIDPWVTVTVYNQQNHSDYKRRTGWAQEVVFRAEFSDLVPGQDYCALANFSFGPPTFPLASSPPSHPHCVHQAAPGPGLQPVLLGIGVCAVLFSPLLALALYRLKQKRDAPRINRLPKTLATLQASLQHPPESSSDPVDPSDIHVEVVDDHLSIISSLSGCVFTNAQAPSLGDGYSSKPFPGDYRSGNMDWHTGGDAELGLNSGSTLSLPCSTVPIGLHMTQCNFGSPLRPHPGPTVPTLPYLDSLSLSEAGEGQGVPLCSVRFGGASEGGENLEGLQWCNR
ncbi:uncharacterized protein si:dkeyp-75h12.7 [Oncorhynchus nerka]|uniref:uncharacterized protein si:dkeyp-75h12.7 n=1 Tax=Oncorhynchus nerka TaxID=8023 RepID=UPI0011305D7F|nr:uncharacterized protein LOC115138879 [Oncorhynchus nerka]